MFVDIAVDGGPLGQVSFKVFVDRVPKTAENFHALSTGQKGFGHSGSWFPRIHVQGADFTCHNGTGGKSIRGEKFDDENFVLKHTGPGISSTAQAGPKTNGSQCFICPANTEWLDVKDKVKEGMSTMEAMECSEYRNGKTSQKIAIADCGQI